MTMFRDGHKPEAQKRGAHNFHVPAQVMRYVETVPVVPIDMMTGQIEQLSDWPTPDSDRPAVLFAAKALIIAAASSAVLGLGVGAPRIGVTPTVIKAPDLHSGQ